MENKNQPAFARPYSRDEYSGDRPESHWAFDGLNKREYFAAKAMQALISNHLINLPKPDGNESEFSEFSKVAIKYADALLKQLEQ